MHERADGFLTMGENPVSCVSRPSPSSSRRTVNALSFIRTLSQFMRSSGHHEDCDEVVIWGWCVSMSLLWIWISMLVESPSRSIDFPDKTLNSLLVCDAFYHCSFLLPRLWEAALWPLMFEFTLEYKELVRDRSKLKKYIQFVLYSCLLFQVATPFQRPMTWTHFSSTMLHTC